MSGAHVNRPAWVFGALFLALLLLDLWYLFQVRGVSFSGVFERITRGPVDHILEDPMWRSAAEQYEALNRRIQGRPAAVFLGDSITKGFPVEEYYRASSDSLLVLNRGINSDTILGLEARFERNIGNLNVRKLFLMIGANDLRYRSAGETVSRIEALLGRVSGARIYVESLLPTPRGRRGVHENAREYNRKLQAMCLRHGYVYLDLFTPFADPRGEMKAGLQADGVHPNGAGYELWRNLIAPCLDR